MLQLTTVFCKHINNLLKTSFNPKTSTYLRILERNTLIHMVISVIRMYWKRQKINNFVLFKTMFVMSYGTVENILQCAMCTFTWYFREGQWRSRSLHIYCIHQKTRRNNLSQKLYFRTAECCFGYFI